MKIRTTPSKKARIEIIPMIDVIFFLLVFFMISSLAVTKTHGVAVNLPKMASDSKATQAQFTVSIKKDGTFFVNSTPTPLENLGALLAYEMRQKPNETVVINADQGTHYGSVIKVMEQVRKIGVRKFSLAIDSEQHFRNSSQM
jgi:biopolymer transport protein ExbD